MGIDKGRSLLGQDEGIRAYEPAFSFGILEHQKAADIQGGSIKETFVARESKKKTFELGL